MEAELGVGNLHDYGARWYDAAIGRFTTVDPLAEDYSFQSPYAYATNNPVLLRDIMGMGVTDYIDIEKSTGEISVTKADGDDQVRLVDNGKVESSYTYGSNGSFSSENTIIKGDFGGVSGTAIVSNKTDNLESFYRFAAKSDVEFAKIDVTDVKTNVDVSIVTTSNNPKISATVPKIVSSLARNGFKGNKVSHSHPDGNPIPSGYNNDFTIDYRQTDGDAAGARSVKRASNTSFRNAIFEVYEPKGNTNTIYDGYNTAKRHKAD